MAGLEPAILRAPNAALYQAELHPATLVRAYRMAVRAHELALRNLSDCKSPAVLSDQRADLGSLGRTRQVVPRHRIRMEEAPTVGARCLRLEASMPGDQPRMPLASLADSTCSIPAVVGGVIESAALPAPRLDRPTAAVKVR